MTTQPVVPAGIFPLGVHVYREPAPDLDEVIRDLRLVKDAGLTMIKIQQSWSTDEPIRGELRVDHLERIIDAAHSLGLGVYVGLTIEQAPMWAWRENPDAFMIDSRGAAHNDPTQYTLPTDGKPGPCWHHPGMRAAAESFIERLVARLSRFENVWVWNTWQEIGFWNNDAGALGFCFCSHSLTSFRNWLQDEYTNLEGLNTAWRTAYTDWAEVEPPRRYTSSPAFLDWRRYMDIEYISDALTWKTDAVRRGDPQKRPVFSHVGFVDVGATAIWDWARTGDFFGSSNYPAWEPFAAWDDAGRRRDEEFVTKHAELWERQLLRSDIIRSAVGRGRTMWAAEYQGGPISTYLDLGRTPDAADIRRWFLSSLAAGAHGISFWNLRAEWFWQEAGGFGLLDRTGDTTERFKQLNTLANAVAEHAALFAEGETPVAEVAILLNQRQYHFAQGSDDSYGILLAGSIRGNYARLATLGVPADFISTNVPAPDLAEQLKRYKLLILPAPLLLPQSVGDALIDFVRAGGTLLSEALPGWIDEDGFARRESMFDGASELFGAHHSSYTRVDEPDKDRRWTPEPRGWGELHAPTTALSAKDGRPVLRASAIIQHLSLSSATPLLTIEDRPVAVQNDFGAGRAILFGTIAGLSATAHADDNFTEFLRHFLQDAGVAVSDQDGLLVRRRVLADQEAVFLINLSDQRLQVARPGGVEGEMATELAPIRCRSSESGIVELEPLEVRCFILSPRSGTAAGGRVGQNEGAR